MEKSKERVRERKPKLSSQPRRSDGMQERKGRRLLQTEIRREASAKGKLAPPESRSGSRERLQTEMLREASAKGKSAPPDSRPGNRERRRTEAMQTVDADGRRGRVDADGAHVGGESGWSTADAGRAHARQTLARERDGGRGEHPTSEDNFSQFRGSATFREGLGSRWRLLFLFRPPYLR